MIRILMERQFTVTHKYISAAGLSTDGKPVGNFVTGSKYVEVDTGKRFLYSEDSGQWIEDTTIASASGEEF